MVHLHVVEKVNGEWKITTGVPAPGMISIESFSSEEEAKKALKEVQLGIIKFI